MRLLDALTDEGREELSKDILFDSYETINDCIFDNENTEHYTPIHSYDREEEDEYLKTLINHFESVIEWYVGPNWREKYECRSI